ncbi:MAG: hypothetical protein GY868_07485 [Deltaproteobacteria bacterium]|nr:hypothetical protein [Deltaproteobacteria bacterium]
MKRLPLVILIACFGFSMSGCEPGNSEPEETNPETEISEPLACFELCHTTLPGLCPDYYNNPDFEYTEAGCESDCQGFWSDVVRSCMTDATECNQITPGEPYCEENPEDPFEYEENPAENNNCDAACTNYAECAGLSAGASAGDLQEAYNSCYSECQGWSEDTITCMSNADGSTPMGCAIISLCGVDEYLGAIQ